MRLPRGGSRFPIHQPPAAAGTVPLQLDGDDQGAALGVVLKPPSVASWARVSSSARPLPQHHREEEQPGAVPKSVRATGPAARAFVVEGGGAGNGALPGRPVAEAVGALVVGAARLTRGLLRGARRRSDGRFTVELGAAVRSVRRTRCSRAGRRFTDTCVELASARHARRRLSWCGPAGLVGLRVRRAHSGRTRRVSTVRARAGAERGEAGCDATGFSDRRSLRADPGASRGEHAAEVVGVQTRAAFTAQRRLTRAAASRPEQAGACVATEE